MMRLINTQTLELKFFDAHVPKYAILSHTWTSGEALLQDWADSKNRHLRPGYEKIVRACAEAADNGLNWLWADTNCIDKTSSAELSEAINSMFKWYRLSHVCYAYLSDVPLATVDECVLPGSFFRRSKWFTRGWTLQELIAPRDVIFFSKDWEAIGPKSALAFCISEITGIDPAILTKSDPSNPNPLRKYSVAQRFSWASHRSTTRIEDQAYSLLGLFDIAMPLVYGEGHHAFTRLMEEIIRRYPDQSFFASQLRFSDFLPRSPREYCDSQSVVIDNSPLLLQRYTPIAHSHSFQMTNTGLQINIPIVPTIVPHLAFGVLNCWEFETDDAKIGDMQATSRPTVSRIWIQLLQKGPPQLNHYSRLGWPRVFFSVKLIPTQNLSSFSPEEQVTAASNHVDLVSTSLHRHILIRKTHAATVSVKHVSLQKDGLIRDPDAGLSSSMHRRPRDFGSPFLVCFPRGVTDYRLYRLYPEDGDDEPRWSAQTPPLLPLVMPCEMGLAPNGATEIYGRLVVFKQSGSLPPNFVAILLVNIIQSHDDGTASAFRSVCKIIPDWSPSQPLDFGELDVNVLTDLDVANDALVTTQMSPWEVKFINLTQVVFDRGEMMEEMRLSPTSQDRTPEGMLHYFGQDYSDDEGATFEDYTDVLGKSDYQDPRKP